LIWIKNAIAEGTLSVEVNDKVGPYFDIHKRVRQGDPFAPLLFNMAANSLAKMVSVEQQNGLVVGLADNIITKGISMLQYADDTILLIQDDLEQARNLKLLLYLFEAMSGLKINFEKSEVMLILHDDNKIQTYSDLFNYQSGTWPIKYLDTPICIRRPTVAEMGFLGDKTKKKMSAWVENNMSIGGRMIKIAACMSSTGVYQMSMRLLHKTTIGEIDKPIRSFFWLEVQRSENTTLSNGGGSVNQIKRWPRPKRSYKIQHQFYVQVVVDNRIFYQPLA
jgi:hypothetical protein